MAAEKNKKSPMSSDISRIYKVNPKNEWGNGLGKRTAKNSIRTVFFNFSEYLSFFIALFLIQSMFWLICFTTSTNVIHRYNVITEQYNYDMFIEGIDINEKSVIENALYIKSFQTIRSFENYEFVDPDEFHDYYSLKVSLKAGKSSGTFIAYYIENTGVGTANVDITYTPRYMFMENYIAETLESGILAAVFLGLMSAVLLMALYSVRINHFKFLYGIYMTCGAGFKKLFSTAKWEMMVVSATTLLASFGATLLTVKIMYSAAGVHEIYIKWWMAPAVIILNLITVYFAVRMPMRHMAKKPPLSLIVAEDNSNLVSSPRRSFRIFNKTFPYHYELYGTWRFRKYLIRTLVTAVLFTSLFISGVYAAHMNKTKIEAAVTDANIRIDYWDIDISGNADNYFGVADAVDLMDEILTECVDNVKGVKYSVWENSEQATSITSHILMQKNNFTGNSDYKTRASNVDDYDVATNYVNYTALDRHYIDLLCSLYEVDGDPYEILSEGNKIIISDLIYNTKNFDFSPGDKIYAAQFLYKKYKIDEIYFDNTEYLRIQIERYAFDYKEYEIAAVIHGSQSEDNIIVGMNYDEYLTFTGDKSLNNIIDVTLDSGLTQVEADRILNDINIGLNIYLGDYGIDYSIVNNYKALKKQLDAESMSSLSIVIVSIMLLLLSPVVWFFSQLLFYKKREKEISLLRMFGAYEKQLRGVYTFAGLIMSALAMVTTVILSVITTFIINKLFNQILPSYGFSDGTRYEFFISGLALLISIAVSVACGFLSSYIPYTVGKHRRKTEYASQLSEQN